MSRLKNYCSLYTGNSISDSEKDNYQYTKDSIPYISTKDITLGSNSINYNNGMYISKTDNYFKIAPKDSVLLCVEGGSAGKKIAYLDEDVCFVNKLCCFSNFKGVPKFLYYYLQSDKFISQFNLNITGLIGGVSLSTLKNFEIAIPSVNIQTRIADYLDCKCSKIDEIIRDNNKEIELLEEYKKNIFKDVISKYETKYYKLKYLLSKKLQYGANSSGVSHSDELPRYVRITDILNNNLKDNDKLSLSDEDAKEFLLNEGDILFARSGATVGKSFVYKNKYGKCAFAGYLIRAQFDDKELSEYVYNYTNSILYEEWKNSIFIQSTIQNIGADKYSIMPIPIPINKNNFKIINIEIERIFNKLDKVIEYRKQIIEKLEEYKKSLIHECVTGKREV